MHGNWFLGTKGGCFRASPFVAHHTKAVEGLEIVNDDIGDVKYLVQAICDIQHLEIL